MRNPWFISLEPPEAFEASGVFETCRVRAGKVLFLRDHLRRLGQSLRTVGISTWEERKARVALIRSAKEIKEGYVRIAVRRTAPFIMHSHRGTPYPEEVKRRGISIPTVATRWPAGETGTAQAKASERLGSILARCEGGAAVEVLRIGPHGYLTEGTVSNLFMVKGDALHTPPHWLGVLEGVTRSRVIQAARRLGIPVKEIPFTRHELFNAEEAFLTNVLMGVLPIREVDGRRIGLKVPGSVTRRLSRILSA